MSNAGGALDAAVQQLRMSATATAANAAPAEHSTSQDSDRSTPGSPSHAPRLDAPGAAPQGRTGKSRKRPQRTDIEEGAWPCNPRAAAARTALEVRDIWLRLQAWTSSACSGC